MELDKNGIVTHIRCVKKDGNARPINLAAVLATNIIFMERNGYEIEDPEYNLHISNKSKPTDFKAKLANEAVTTIDNNEVVAKRKYTRKEKTI